MPKKRRQQQVEPPPTPQPTGDLPVIKVVGLSAAGKSTLVRGLRAQGYNARPVSQEHANVPDLWQQFDRTHRLIYLGVTLAGQRRRREDVSWSEEAYADELVRLAHAREHADLRIDTTGLTADETLQLALKYLRTQKVRHADGPLEPLPRTGSAGGRPRLGGTAS